MQTGYTRRLRRYGAGGFLCGEKVCCVGDGALDVPLSDMGAGWTNRRELFVPPEDGECSFLLLVQKKGTKEKDT